MTYPTIMIQMEVGRQNTGLLRVASHLAEQFQAEVLGIAACQPIQPIYGTDCYVAAAIMEQDRLEIEMQLDAVELEFRTMFSACPERATWRSTVTCSRPSNYLAREARAVDLILTGGNSTTSPQVNKGDLIIQAGRPVLIVPSGVDQLTLNQVVIGWKDTREARRAAHDALPLLRRAGRVVVVEIAAERDLAQSRGHLADVVKGLRRHGVSASYLALPSVGDDVVQLRAVARERHADVLVAGAYGHSRLHEWALGGVTRDLLLHAERCSFVSH